MTDPPRLSVLAGHADLPCALAFSSDGLLLASGDRQGWVYLWDLSEARRDCILRHADLRRRPEWPDTARSAVRGSVDVTHLAFLPGGARLAVALGFGGVEVWNLAGGSLERRLPRLRGPVVADGAALVAFRYPRAANTVRGSESGRVVWIDPETGRRTKELALPGLTAWSTPCVDPNLRRVAVREEGEVRTWDLDTGALVASVRVSAGGEADGSDFVGLAPDGRAVVRTQGTVAWVDLASRAVTPVIRVDEYHHGPLGDPIGTPDGLLVPQRGALLRFDVAGVLTVLEGRGARALAARGPLVAAGEDSGRLRLVSRFGSFDLPTVQAAVSALGFAPDGDAVVSAHADGVIRTWSLSTGACIATRRCPWGQLVALHPDGTLAASVTEGSVWAWDTGTGEIRQRTNRHHSLSAPWVLGGRTLACRHRGSHRGDGGVLLWDLTTGALRLEQRDAVVRALAIDHRGERLAIAGARGTGVSLLALASAGHSGPLGSSDEGDDAVSLAFSPDGDTLALGTLGFRVARWNLAQGGPPVWLRAHRDSLEVAVSRDGRIAAAPGYDASIWLHDPARAACRALFGHRGSARAVAFSPDGRWLASGAADGAVCLWDPRTGARVRTHQVLPAGDDWVSHTPRGDWIGSELAGRFLTERPYRERPGP